MLVKAIARSRRIAFSKAIKCDKEDATPGFKNS